MLFSVAAMQGLVAAPWLFGIRLLWVPSRCLRKYSLPLAEEPMMLERQTIIVRGQFSGASTSSMALASAPDFSWPATHSPTVAASRQLRRASVRAWALWLATKRRRISW